MSSHGQTLANRMLKLSKVCPCPSRKCRRDQAFLIQSVRERENDRERGGEGERDKERERERERERVRERERERLSERERC